MIGIRTGGVFSGEPILDKMKEKINELLPKYDDGKPCYCDLDWCMSKNLTMFKGSYVVLAGVSNGWSWEDARSRGRI